MSPYVDVIWNDITPVHRHLRVAVGPRCYPSLGPCLASSITQRKTTLEAWMGHRAVAGLTWLCYMITQPVGCPPVKCLPALMNGCNMPRITTLHATHSLMASHHARDVPPMPRRDSQGEKGVVVVVREWGWEMAFMNTCFRVAIHGSKQRKPGVLIWIISQTVWQRASVAVTRNANEWTKGDRNWLRWKFMEYYFIELLFPKVRHTYALQLDTFLSICGLFA